MDGYDDCILGTCERFGQETIVAYDLDKVLAELVAEGCSLEEAEEFWEFNQLGAWVGDETPCFIRTNVEGLDTLETELRKEITELRKEITELKEEAFDALTIIESFIMNDDQE